MESMTKPRKLLPPLLLALLAGCTQKGANEAGTSAPPPSIRELPVEITLAQRTQLAVPGSDGQLFAAIDDVTAGQVVVTLTSEDQTPVFGPLSMKLDDQHDFTFQDYPLRIQLKKLSNALIGEDYATLVILPQPQGLSEQEKIDSLIDAVANLPEGTVFIRNGKEHTLEEAVDHLGLKRKKAGDKIKSSREFIEHLASKSSMSGKPYQIKMPDGQTQEAGSFFLAKLAEIEAPKTQ